VDRLKSKKKCKLLILQKTNFNQSVETQVRFCVYVNLVYEQILQYLE